MSDGSGFQCRPRHRAGITLIEMTATTAIAALVLGMAGSGLRLLLRAQADGVPGQTLDLVCDRLRRDLAGGARVEGADLVAGGARWNAAPPARNGRPCAGVQTLAWHHRAGTWEVVLTPVGGPPRVVAAAEPTP